MQRYFVFQDGDALLLKKEDEHHFLDVMRGKLGEIVEGVYEGKIYTLQVVSLSPLRFKTLKIEAEQKGEKAHLSLAFSLLKHGNDDLVFEKATELGVADFYPFVSERTIIRLEKEEDKKKKLERYSKIVKGASEQSKRTRLPLVHPILSFAEVLALPSPHKLFAYEEKKDETGSFQKELQRVQPGEEVLIVIGPEGGFSPKEAALAERQGWTAISLGERILRAETASLYAASVFSFFMEGKR